MFFRGTSSDEWKLLPIVHLYSIFSFLDKNDWKSLATSAKQIYLFALKPLNLKIFSKKDLATFVDNSINSERYLQSRITVDMNYLYNKRCCDLPLNGFETLDQLGRKINDYGIDKCQAAFVIPGAPIVGTVVGSLFGAVGGLLLFCCCMQCGGAPCFCPTCACATNPVTIEYFTYSCGGAGCLLGTLAGGGALCGESVECKRNIEPIKKQFKQLQFFNTSRQMVAAELQKREQDKNEISQTIN